MKNIFFFLIMLLDVSCSKDDDNNNNAPDNLSVITITTPVAGFTYLNGGNLRIEGEINDLDKVSLGKVQIKNKTTNAVYFEQSTNAGNVTRYFFLWNWSITAITTPVTATITVTSKDQRGFEISKAVDVTINP